MPETPPSADLFLEKPSAERVSEPGPTTEVAAVVEPVRTEISVPPNLLRNPLPRVSPRSPRRIIGVNWQAHWGLRLLEPEPEPEPEPEAAPVIAEIDNQMFARHRPFPTPMPRNIRNARTRTTDKTTDQEPSRTPRAELGFDAGVRTRSEPRQGLDGRRCSRIRICRWTRPGS